MPRRNPPEFERLVSATEVRRAATRPRPYRLRESARRAAQSAAATATETHIRAEVASIAGASQPWIVTDEALEARNSWWNSNADNNIPPPPANQEGIIDLMQARIASARASTEDDMMQRAYEAMFSAQPSDVIPVQEPPTVRFRGADVVLDTIPVPTDYREIEGHGTDSLAEYARRNAPVVQTQSELIARLNARVNSMQNQGNHGEPIFVTPETYRTVVDTLATHRRFMDPNVVNSNGEPLSNVMYRGHPLMPHHMQPRDTFEQVYRWSEYRASFTVTDRRNACPYGTCSLCQGNQAPLEFRSSMEIRSARLSALLDPLTNETPSRSNRSSASSRRRGRGPRTSRHQLFADSSPETDSIIRAAPLPLP